MPLTLPISPSFLSAKRQIGDPLADETLQKIIAENGPTEAKKLFDILIGQVEMPIAALPQAAQDFLSATKELPDWTDWQKVNLANELFLDHGPKFMVFLYYRSLPILYSCAHGAKVLVQTGRLSHKTDGHQIFARRVAETGQFLLEVMKPGALLAGGRGIQAIQKIRLIHASIRAFTPKDHWDAATFGVPINQEDMAITLLTFSSVVTDSLEQFGIKENDELTEAYLHSWAAIGSLMGIDDDLLPADLPAARLLQNAIMERQSEESDEGRMLTKALLTFAAETLPDRFQKLPPLLIHHLNGAELAAKLGVVTTPGCLGSLVPSFIKGLFRLTERLEDQVKEPLSDFVHLFGVATTKAFVRFFEKHSGRAVELPKEWDH